MNFENIRRDLEDEEAEKASGGVTYASNYDICHCCTCGEDYESTPANGPKCKCCGSYDTVIIGYGRLNNYIPL